MKNNKAFIVGIIIALAVLFPVGLVVGGIALFSYSNFGTSGQREQSRDVVEKSLLNVSGVEDVYIREHLGGTPPSKADVWVNVYVDGVPEEEELTQLVESVFRITWREYTTFTPDSIWLMVINDKKPEGIEDRRQEVFEKDSVTLTAASKKYEKWLSYPSSSGGVSASSRNLAEAFGQSGNQSK